jgi:hypothetical protein
MIGSDRAVCTALVVAAAALGMVGASATAAAQSRHPTPATAASEPERARAGVPYPGATVTIDPRWYSRQQVTSPNRRGQWVPRSGGPAVVYYVVPPPVQGGYYPGAGYGGGVTDANGRPLYMGDDQVSPSQSYSGGYGLGTPNLTGTPYVVGDGGAMLIDFGGGDKRSIPSCAAQEAARDPAGRPRTIFYSPRADGLILRAGENGRVQGAPPVGAPVCYTADQYGRILLDY